MQKEAMILSILQLHVPRVERHPNSQGADLFGPWLSCKAALAGCGASERVAGAAKRYQERIARLLDFMSAVPPDLISDQRVMGR
jgi:hypothetical protein